MRPRCVLAPVLMFIFLFTVMGCATTGGSSGGSSVGWIVPQQPGPAPPPQQARPAPPPRQQRPAPPPQQHKYEPERKPDNRGQETAARNHIRSAYRFLQQGKPDHALRELEKARSRMGDNFWFYYYRGGAYFLRGMYQKANESWSVALRYTRDARLRSRLKTCQSFAVYHLQGGDESAVGLLRAAIGMDRENRQARTLLDDMEGPERSSGPEVGFNRHSPGTAGKQVENGGHPANAGRKNAAREKPGRTKARPLKIGDNGQFRAYFLVEMGKN